MSPKTSILIAEDEILIAMQLRHKLGTLGYQVYDLATTGDQAIRLADIHHPHILLMDVRLTGGIDGIQAAETICTDDSDSILIFMTGYSDPDITIRMQQLHPAAILEKPVTIGRLQQAIEGALGKGV